MKRPTPWTPSAEQMALWPSISGNTINGVDETQVRQPSAIYWHAPDATPHGPLQLWFMKRTTPLVQAARQERQAAIDLLVAPVADRAIERSAEEWTQRVKDAALAAGADVVGIAAVQPQWVFEGYEVTQRWVIVIVSTVTQYSPGLSSKSPHPGVRFHRPPPGGRALRQRIGGFDQARLELLLQAV